MWTESDVCRGIQITYREVPGPYLEVGLRNRGKLEGRQETAVRGSGSLGVDTILVRRPPPTGSLAPFKGVVLGYGQPCSAARSVNPERVTVERVDLFSYVPHPGENIPVSVDTFPVDDLVPTEDNIEWAVT